MNYIFAAVMSSVTLLMWTCSSDAAPAQPYLPLTFQHVYDGDTIVVTYDPLPEPLNKLRIRLEGIDTPELGIRSRCESENLRAVAAKAYLVELLSAERELHLYDYHWDKYGGRILGELRVTGGNVADLMIAAGHALPYHGVGTRSDWCASSATK